MRHLFGPFGLIGKLGFLGIRHVVVVGARDTWTGEQPPPPRLVPSLPVLHLLLVPAATVLFAIGACLRAWVEVSTSASTVAFLAFPPR